MLSVLLLALLVLSLTLTPRLERREAPVPLRVRRRDPDG